MKMAIKYIDDKQKDQRVSWVINLWYGKKITTLKNINVLIIINDE